MSRCAAPHAQRRYHTPGIRRPGRRVARPWASSLTQPPPTPTPTPASPPSTPAELTLVERWPGRSATAYTWTRTNTSSAASSSLSSQEEEEQQPGTFTTGTWQVQQQHHHAPGDPGTSAAPASASASGSSTPSGLQLALRQRWQQLRASAQALYLPAGWPGSVTDDYLAYQLATVPAHITGWLSISLTTSSLLKAVGISAGPVGATAAAAAIKWIVKDGLGAAGRLLVGGRLGLEFDDDPRRWRMAAEALTSAGLALEVATAVFPQHFLLLASVGNFSKAVGKGMGKPVFRVIQTHFAASGNVGAVAAKEEVWEVSAQLVGYALSVLMLEQLQDAGSWQTVIALWAVVQAAHVMLRYTALLQLRFRYLNQKRAKLLVASHVRGRALPSVAQGNQQEPLFSAAADLAPHVTLGCSLAEAWGVGSAAELAPAQLGPWWRLFEGEGYLLVWRGGHAYVVLKEGGGGALSQPQEVQQSQQQRSQQRQQQQQQQQEEVLLRALWQAAWLDAHAAGAGAAAGASLQQHGPMQDSHSEPLLAQQQEREQQLLPLQASLDALRAEFGGFMADARVAGWRTDQVVLRVGDARLQMLGAGASAGAGSDSDLADLDQ